MHDSMPYGPIQGQGQLRNSSIFKIYLVRYFQWELASDCLSFNKRTISKFVRTGSLMSVSSFLCHVTLTWKNLACRRSRPSVPLGSAGLRFLRPWRTEKNEAPLQILKFQKIDFHLKIL